MPIVKLQSAKNLTDLAQRLYGLPAGDARIATAVRALTAASPHLPDDLSTLPPQTPIIAPAIAGLPLASGAQTAVPQEVELLELVSLTGEAVNAIVTAAAAGQAQAQDTTRAAMLQRFAAAQAALNIAPRQKTVSQQQFAARLKTFGDNVAAFLKTHGG